VITHLAPNSDPPQNLKVPSVLTVAIVTIEPQKPGSAGLPPTM